MFSPRSNPSPKKEEKVKKENALTAENVITSSGRYKDRADSLELTEQIRQNIDALVNKVNDLLNELGIERADVTSGFRTQSSNAATKNAAKKSNHMNGDAVDIMDDKDQTLAAKITKDLLIKHDLFMESPKHTKGARTNWVHLQTTKTRSGNRIFIP